MQRPFGAVALSPGVKVAAENCPLSLRSSARALLRVLLGTWQQPEKSEPPSIAQPAPLVTPAHNSQSA